MLFMRTVYNVMCSLYLQKRRYQIKYMYAQNVSGRGYVNTIIVISVWGWDM